MSGQLKRSILWNSGATFVNVLFSLIVTAVLARLIAPNYFGTFALIFVLIGFVDQLKDLGISVALVQTKKIDQELLSTVFWFFIIQGIVLFIAVRFIAAPYSNYFEDTLALNALLISSFIFLISSTNTVHSTLLKRNMEFDKIAFVSIPSNLISGGFAIFLALKGFKIEALIAKSLMSSLITSLGLWYQSKWLPSFAFRFQSLKKIYKFSRNVSILAVIHYLTKNVDKLIIGKFFSTLQLGFYSKALNINKLQISLINQQLLKVFFPFLSKLQDDINEVAKVYFRFTSYMCIIYFFITTFLIVASNEIVLVMFGETWLAMVPILQVTLLLVFVYGLNSSGTILKSIDKTDILLKYSLITKISYIVLLLLAYSYGFEFFLWTIVIGSMFTIVVTIYITAKALNISVLDYLEIIFPYLVFAIIIYFSFDLVFDRYFLNRHFLVILIYKFILFSFCYISFLYLVTPKPAKEVYLVLIAKLEKFKNKN